MQQSNNKCTDSKKTTKWSCYLPSLDLQTWDTVTNRYTRLRRRRAQRSCGGSVLSKTFSVSNQHSLITLVLAVAAVWISRGSYQSYHRTALPSPRVSLVQRSSAPAGGVERAGVKTITVMSRTAWRATLKLRRKRHRNSCRCLHLVCKRVRGWHPPPLSLSMRRGEGSAHGTGMSVGCTRGRQTVFACRLYEAFPLNNKFPAGLMTLIMCMWG